MLARRVLKKDILRNVYRQVHDDVSGGQRSSSAPPPPVTSKQTNVEVPGLSSAVVTPANEPVGPNVDPNKSGAYKAPEYFCYHAMSYFEAEIEMSKFRVPQPSALKK